MPTVNEELLDRQIRHAVYLQRYSAGTSRKMLNLLRAAEVDLRNRLLDDLEGLESSFTQKRLAAVLRNVRAMRRDLYETMGETLASDLAELADYEVGYQLSLLDDVTPLAVTFTAPSAATVRAAALSQPFRGRLLKDWANKLRDDDLVRVKQEIRLGVVEGDSIPNIVRRIRGTRALGYTDGVLEISRREATAVARTAVNHTVTAAKNTVVKANEDVIKGVQWLATLDGRTSAVCRARDNVVYPTDSGPRPPAHINCRSTITYVLKSWEELGIDRQEIDAGTRASMDGEVPEDLSYGDWLKRQNRGFIDDVLGKSKAKLFIDGELPIDRFIDRRGTELTLAQLQQRDPGAWQKAFGTE